MKYEPTQQYERNEKWKMRIGNKQKKEREMRGVAWYFQFSHIFLIQINSFSQMRKFSMVSSIEHTFIQNLWPYSPTMEWRWFKRNAKRERAGKSNGYNCRFFVIMQVVFYHQKIRLDVPNTVRAAEKWTWKKKQHFTIIWAKYCAVNTKQTDNFYLAHSICNHWRLGRTQY